MEKRMGVIGGDRRQAELARLLREDGYTVHTCGLGRWLPDSEECLELAAAAPVVILPLPLCREAGMLNWEGLPLSTQTLFAQLRPDQRLLAGQVQPAQQAEAAACGLTLEDYFLREELTVANAAITAEGAVQTALERLDGTLWNRSCLVLGFGRIGRLLSYRLHGMGARVTTAARKPADRAWVRAYGWEALDSGALDGRLSSFGAVFNTVPARILDGALLAQLPRDCLLVDLASQPGIDGVRAAELGLDCVWARGLPGRTAPCAAAAALRDTITYILMGG